MSGIEYLNLQNHRDLMRVGRDLQRQAKILPRDEALQIFRLCRPEIVAFASGQKLQKSRLTQLQLDMTMTELLLHEDVPYKDQETLEECRQILVDSIEFLHDFLKGADDDNLWGRYGTCCHRLIQCCRELDHQVEAEAYCEQFHHACRQISRLCGGWVSLEEHLRLILQMYEDTEEVYSRQPDPGKRLVGYRAKMRRERFGLWYIRLKEQEKLQNTVRIYLDAAADMTEKPTPGTLKLAMEFCTKAMDIIRNNISLWGMRSYRIKCWITMGYIWELRGTAEDFREAKDCYVHAADAAKSYYHRCVRDKSGTYDAADYLKRCYGYIAEMYEKFPGEKNEKKAARYRALAENQE